MVLYDLPYFFCIYAKIIVCNNIPKAFDFGPGYLIFLCFECF